MQDDPSREAGDPACWLGVICPHCGEVREDRRGDHCANCGYDFDAMDASDDEPSADQR